MLTQARFDARWMAMLDDAIAGHGVSLHAQPIVDLASGRVVAYETLARFSHPEAEGVSPAVWFAKARENRAVAELQATVLRTAMQLLPALPQESLLAVNVEPDTLTDPRTCAALLDHADLSRVVVELTEHAAWTWDEIAPTIKELRLRGARTAIDDAGSGYAVVEQIDALEPMALKLDRTIVSGIGSDVGRQALVSMLLGISSRVGAVLVAEGVETIADAQRLVTCGVTHLQGYLLAPPGAPWPELDRKVMEVLAASTGV